jgi:hypothetical protein
VTGKRGLATKEAKTKPVGKRLHVVIPKCRINMSRMGRTNISRPKIRMFEVIGTMCLE